MTLLINHRLIDPYDVVVVCVSGGIDSMVMLDQLNKLKKTYHLTLIVAHINHGIRKESDEEFEFVKQRAEAYGNAFEGLVIRKWPKTNFHDAARKKRYEFFLSVAKKHNASKIALAHHLDDQAETILMRLVRGTSFKGYSGIKASVSTSDCIFIRPLLKISRKTIETYQSSLNLPYRSDASNESDAYSRNRYRHHILPLVALENPNYLDKFEQFSTYIEEANDLVESLSNVFIDQHVIKRDNAITFSVEAFNHLSRIVKRDVLKRLTDRLTNDQVELSFKHMQQLLSILEGSKPHGDCVIRSPYRAERSYDTFRLYHFDSTIKTPDPITINSFGTFEFGDDTFVVCDTLPNNIHGIYLELWYNNLDLIFPLSLRLRQEGDRIRMKQGTKKVKDLFIDLKLPKSKRDRMPILVDSTDTIRWIPGVFKSPANLSGSNVLYIIYNRG